jgi:hypothetical protein
MVALNPMPALLNHRDALGPQFGRFAKLPGANRLIHTGVGLVYLFFFLSIYRDYVSYVWGYAGFRFRVLEAWEVIFIAAGVALVSFAMPQRLLRPSAIVIWLMYAFFYVPTMAMTFMIGDFPSGEYIAPLGALTMMMVAISVVSQLPMRAGRTVEMMPGRAFVLTILVLFAAITVLQYIMYREIISFASVEDVYYQRFAASELGGGPVGYARTHYYYVISPTLVAIGLCSRRYRLLLPFGIAGFIFTYMIDASKIALVVPLAMIALYWIAVKTPIGVNLFTGGLTFLTFVCSLFTSQVSFIRFIADLMIVRSISSPAQTYHQYYDLFTQRGYTWWSNVSGIRQLVPPPSGFAHDPAWPTLGLIIGREYYGSTLMNANANPFSGEGVAAAGTLGVVIIGLFMAGWLRAFDLAARGWNRVFALLIAAPLGLCLTNVHLSTLLVSFGGIFWLAVLSLHKPGPRIYQPDGGGGAPQ